MIEIVNRNGKVIHRSKSLRGILDHGRRSLVEAAVAIPLQHGKGALWVLYADGCRCRAEFADYTVLCDWLRSRRSWAGARRIGDEQF